MDTPGPFELPPVCVSLLCFALVAYHNVVSCQSVVGKHPYQTGSETPACPVAASEAYGEVQGITLEAVKPPWMNADQPIPNWLLEPRPFLLT